MERLLISERVNPPAPEESVSEKLLRETQLFGAGFNGVGKAAEEAFSAEQLLPTLGKIGGGLAIGAGMAYLSRGAAVRTIGARIAGTTMAASFGMDILANAGQVSYAVSDTWKSGVNWDRNVKIMESSLGKFAFDSVLMTAAGFAGGGVQMRLSGKPAFKLTKSATEMPETLESVVLRRHANPLPEVNSTDLIMPTLRPGFTGVSIVNYCRGPLEPILRTNLRSIVRVEAPNGKGPKDANVGTGFFVNEQGLLATSYHVVKHSGGRCTVQVGSGPKMEAKIHAVDMSADVALLKVMELPSGVAFKPVKLAESLSAHAPSTKTVTLGFAEASSHLHVAEGAVKSDTMRYKWINSADKMPYEDPNAFVLWLTARAHGGCSGGPVFNSATGEVVGIVSLGLGSKTTYARPTHYIRDLMLKPEGHVRRYTGPQELD